MGLRISTNIASMAAQRALSNTADGVKKSYERLATGNRITTAGDDAAGLSISEHLRAKIRSLTQAERNANDGLSFVQVAEGGLTEVSNILIRLRELSIQAASDTIGDKERAFINEEVQSLVKEVDRIANVTTFGGTPLLNGEAEKELQFQVGIQNHEADRINFDANQYNITASELDLEGLDYSETDGARDSMEYIEKAMDKVFSTRASLGATQNKIHSTVNNIMIARENSAIARSRIADTDVAAETSDLVQKNILQQAGVAVLSQANMAPMQALKLL